MRSTRVPTAPGSVPQGQALVHESDGYAALTHAGSHSLGRAGANISEGEDTVRARLQGERAAQGLPP
ncbi:hypothetical protein GCM10023166_18480 [Paeniglutamicibacter cryotolerans]